MLGCPVSVGAFAAADNCPKECYNVPNKIKKPEEGSQGPAWAVKATDNMMIIR
jgi:hypothetical protein